MERKLPSHCIKLFTLEAGIPGKLQKYADAQGSDHYHAISQ
jgi:hypothetical protein